MPPSLIATDGREPAQDASIEAGAFSFLDPGRQRHAVPDWASLDGLVIPGEDKAAKTSPRISLSSRLGLAAVAGVPMLLAAQGALACLLP